jgi:hypothetical protein
MRIHLIFKKWFPVHSTEFSVRVLCLESIFKRLVMLLVAIEPVLKCVILFRSCWWYLVCTE